MFDCRPSIGVRMDMRRRRPGFSRPSVGGYYRTYATRLGCRLFETTTPRVVLRRRRRIVAESF